VVVVLVVVAVDSRTDVKETKNLLLVIPICQRACSGALLSGQVVVVVLARTELRSITEKLTFISLRSRSSIFKSVNNLNGDRINLTTWQR
jgi:hypothetical protein